VFLTKWVGRLIAANIVVFVLTMSSDELFVLLTLYPSAALVRPWTVVTYMFVHGGTMHLLFNMIGLVFFGPRLESRLGSKSFLALYFLSGLGGAALSFVFARDTGVVGASGAVYGILMGFAMFWPHERMIIFPIPVPLEARVVVAGYVALSIVQGVGGAASGIAHFAHLGGALFAFLYLRWAAWHLGAAKRDFQQKLRPEASPRGVVGDQVALERWRGISVASMHELNRGEVERLLAKAERDGPGSLSQSERDFLDRMSGR
jgi:membrane associated rhomboid family serine protease